MTSRTAALLAAAVIGAGVARARSLDWSDDPDAAGKPTYAASRGICRGLTGRAPPPGDAPTPAEAAALADCSSEALYYGIGRPADPKAARLCASVETKTADPQVTDFGFTGDRMLMTVYANGVGGARDLDLATALACRAGGAPAEVDGRVRHLAKLKARGWTGTDFSLCDDVTSGLMMGVCADHDQLIARAARSRAFAALSAGWSPAQREAFVVAAEDKQERAFAALLADAEAGRIKPAGADDAKVEAKVEAETADGALNAAYRDLMRRAPALAKDSTLTASGLAATERAWLRYRDAWMAFAKLRYPALPPDALLARLTRDRAAQLADVPAEQD